MSPKKDNLKSTGFSDEEKAAMQERAQELKAERRGSPNAKVDGESAVLAKIDEMLEPDRSMARRLHDLIKTSAPELTSRLWYGMPAYAKDGSVVCFFQSGQKFKTRYCTLGFSDKAKLDDGVMWPSAFAIQELTPSEEVRIAALVRKAVG